MMMKKVSDGTASFRTHSVMNESKTEILKWLQLNRTLSFWLSYCISEARSEAVFIRSEAQFRAAIDKLFEDL